MKQYKKYGNENNIFKERLKIFITSSHSKLKSKKKNPKIRIINQALSVDIFLSLGYLGSETVIITKEKWLRLVQMQVEPVVFTSH